MPLTVGPCAPYVDAAEVVACDDSIDPEAAEQAALVASRVLYLATGLRYDGDCVLDAVRPCGCSTCCGPAQRMGWATILWPGTTGCGGSCLGSRCGCGGIDELDLQLTPIQSVTEVKVDGDVLVDGTDYRVDDWRWLVRLGGERWPTCQNMAEPDTEEGTWSVSGTWGLAASPLVVTGSLALAVEIAKQMCGGGSGPCKLSPRATAQVRQGTSVDLLDPQDFLTANPDGGPNLTGVYLADLAISHENPDGLVADGVFLNPDTYRPNVRRVNTSPHSGS